MWERRLGYKRKLQLQKQSRLEEKETRWSSSEMEKGLTIWRVRTSRSVPTFNPEYYLFSHPSWNPPCLWLQAIICEILPILSNYDSYIPVHAIPLITNVKILILYLSSLLGSFSNIWLLLRLIHGQRIMTCHSRGNSLEKAISKKNFVWQHCWNQCIEFQGNCPKGQH